MKGARPVLWTNKTIDDIIAMTIIIGIIHHNLYCHRNSTSSNNNSNLFLNWLNLFLKKFILTELYIKF